ncbi:hypothetical protein N7493_010469, partial [Penicillium malachiteum]
QKESPPNPTSNVPFPRDPDFVPCGTLLDEIHAKTSTCPGSWVALVGLGGVGKSQLAIEYCYRVQDQSPETWVFWMHAGNAARLEEGFQDAADRLKIPNRHDPGANVFKMVYDWLRDNSDWLVILDNLDDASFLHEPLRMDQEGRSVDRRSLSSFLPRGSNGTLIMTTRSKDATLRLVDSKNIIEVHPMDISDAVELVNNKMNPPVIEMDAQSLAEALGFIPLAIYKQQFERNEGRKSKLLGYEAGHSQRDRDANNSILITWRISFEQVRKINSSAADLLSLMSFFDPHGISEDLLQTPIKVASKSKDGGHKRETSSSSDSDSSKEAEALGIEVLDLQKRAFGEENSSTIKSMGSLAFTYLTSGRLQEAEVLGTQVLDLYKKILGEENPGTLLTMNRLRSTYKGQGRLKEAETLGIQALDLCKKAMGEEQPHTIRSMRELASIYLDQDRLQEAEVLYIQVLDLSRKILGEDHPKTINNMQSFAITYQKQGRLEDAERLEIQVLDHDIEVFGYENQDTLFSMENLALTWKELGRVQEGRVLLQDCVAKWTRFFGPENPHTVVASERLLSWENEERSVDEN